MSNLSHGFLFHYDWIPMIHTLSGEEFKALFLALIARQREGTPIPTLEGALTNTFAAMIEPIIQRRLDGQYGGRKAQASTCAKATAKDTTQGTSEAIREKKIKEDKSRYTSAGTKTAPPGVSVENFDGDEFFTAALVRSYGYDPREK